MLSEREVISTLNMLRNEHLDVRTVTLGVSLFDCASHDIELFTANVQAKLRRYAAQLVAVCNEVGDKYGIPVVNKRISVSPVAVVGAPFGPDGMVRICRALDEAAKEAGVDFPLWWKKAFPAGIAPSLKRCRRLWPARTAYALPSTWLRRAAASTWTPWPSWGGKS